MEKIDPSTWLTTFELLHLVTPTVQIIDGELEACGPGDDNIVLRIRAVDSTSWDVESAALPILEPMRAAFDGSDEN